VIFIYKTKDVYVSGSVSVFFAIIIVVLITFLFTIFDFTRLQIIQLEASSNFDTAALVALSQYEPLLLHQYGLFAGHQGIEVEAVFNECLETQFYPDKAKKHTYLLDYYLEEQSKLQKLSFMEPKGYEYELTYEPFINYEYDYPREQVLEFMKLREPYLLLKPFLLNLDILSKSSRSSSVIEEKNDLVTSFKTIESYKLQLYKLIDGIEIYDNGDWSLLENSNYVRKFSYNEGLDYSYFPNSAWEQLKEPVINYLSIITPLEPLLNSVEDDLVTLLSSEPFIFIYTHKEEGVEPQLLGVVEKESTKKAYQSLESLNAGFIDFEILKDTISSQLICNQEALIIINELEGLCKSNITEIEEYQQRLMTKDDIIESVSNQINKELNALKSEMMINDINFSQVNNLPLMKKQLEINIKSLSNGLTYMESLNNIIDDYIYRRYLSLKTETYLNGEQLQRLDDKMAKLLANQDYMHSPVDKSTVTNLKNYCDGFISQYDSNLLFDYLKLGINKPAENEYEDKEKGLLGFDLLNVFKEYDLIKFYPGLAIDEVYLPSHQISPDFLSMIDFSMMDRGITTNVSPVNINILDLASLSKIATDLHESVLINEYAVGMFSNVSKANNPNSKTLNGFKVDEHFLNYETEYILGGHLDEQKNMDEVLRYLYGIRMSLNILHLAMDPTKRTTIMNIANTIAGWWTGGVGAIIIAIIIAGFWALLESIADVFVLVSGKRVPVIKTRSSWYTSLDGNVMELFNEGVQRVENDFVSYTKEINKLVDIGFEGINTTMETNEMIDANEDYILVKSYVEELRIKVKEFGEEIGFGIESYGMNFDSKLNDYIDLNLMMLSEEDSHEEISNPFEDEESLLLSQNILQNINLSYFNLPKKERTLAALIRLKYEVMEQYENHISEYKESYKTKMTTIYKDTIKFQMATLEEGVSELMKSGTKIGRKIIVDKADDIKEEFLSEVKESVAKESGIEAFIPSFSYDDYLRLFLLLPIVDEKTKIARMMDLIQMNTQKVYDDYDMKLVDYYVGVQAKGTVKVKTLFIPNVDKFKVKKYWELGVYHVSKHY